MPEIGCQTAENQGFRTACGGVPARHIKWRTDPETIDFLLKYKWWDKSKEELEAMRDIMQSDIDLCKVNFERMKAKI